jgi:hypothetical protein
MHATRRGRGNVTLRSFDEMQRDYDALTARIVALDIDINRETDSERRMVLKAKRDDLAREREELASDIAVLHPGYPLSVVANAPDLERRVTAIERDIKRIWAILRPNPRKIVARILFYALLVFLVSIWLKSQSFDWLIAHPAQAFAISTAIVIAAAIVYWLPEDDDHERP